MIEKFKSYFTKLERLSHDELDRSAQTLVKSENRSVAKLIAHLAEMSERKTALELGYKSLYDYAARRLNLSEGAVPARIHVTNVSRRFPQLLAALAESRISLTVACLLAPHLTEDNIEMLISDCAGMRRRETEEYLVALKPKPVFEPSIRKRPVRAESSRPTSTPPPSPPSTPPPADPPKSSPPILQPATPELYNFRFSATRDFKDKFERLAEVVGVDNAQKNTAEILEKALDIALDKKDPKKKLERRRKRQEAASEPSRSERDGEKDERAESRYVASEVSERVHERDGYQCLYFAPDGTRCTSRVGLHLDHRSPFGIFHNNGEQVLRLLCPAHNLLMAERVYGVDFLQQKLVKGANPAPRDARGISSQSIPNRRSRTCFWRFPQSRQPPIGHTCPQRRRAPWSDEGALANGFYPQIWPKTQKKKGVRSSCFSFFSLRLCVFATSRLCVTLF